MSLMRNLFLGVTIERFSRQLHKVTKAKIVFPTDDSLFKILYLAMMDIAIGIKIVAEFIPIWRCALKIECTINSKPPGIKGKRNSSSYSAPLDTRTVLSLSCEQGNGRYAVP